MLRQNAVYSSEKAVSVPGELLPIPEGRHPRTFRRGGETRRDYTKPVNGFASLLELAGLCIGRRPAATALKEADIADPSFIDELEKSGFIDQLYAAYRPLPALSGSPSSKSEASGFAPFSDVVLRISRDVVASTNATVARPEWRPCSWRYSRQSKRDVQDLGLPFRTHPQSAVLE